MGADRLGVIAGSGRFPVIFVSEAKKKGCVPIVFAVRGITSEEIGEVADRVHWIDVEKFRVQKFIFLLIAERIKKMAMVGKIDKSMVFRRLDQNKDVEEVLKGTRDNMDYTILEEVTNRLAKIGITVISGLDYLSDLLPQKGVITERQPTEEEMRDVFFGMDIARELAGLDVGQTITVKNKAIVTVEAMEGTDLTIRRAGDLLGSDFVVVKLARPKQDMRWDVPLIGPETIRTMSGCQGRVLAIESGRMFLSEKEKTVREANINNISIVVV
ncbi:MAG: UDP-2,3-diacylglucosamine diphosphatase LpxI [Candidatus Omnitrophota bacterium]